MIKFFYNLFNHGKIDELNKIIDVYKERNEQLEKEVMEYKDYKLKYEVTKLYVEDDDALLELFELAEAKGKTKAKTNLIDLMSGRADDRSDLANGASLANRPYDHWMRDTNYLLEGLSGAQSATHQGRSLANEQLCSGLRQGQWISNQLLLGQQNCR